MSDQQMELISQPQIKPQSADYIESVLIWLQEFLYWWYLHTPVQLFRVLKRFFLVADDSLSFSVVFRHFFSPWHRDPSAAGWGVGIVIKLFYLPLALLIMIIGSLLFVAGLLVWIALPPLVIVYILLSPILS